MAGDENVKTISSPYSTDDTAGITASDAKSADSADAKAVKADDAYPAEKSDSNPSDADAAEEKEEKAAAKTDAPKAGEPCPADVPCFPPPPPGAPASQQCEAVPRRARS